MDIKPIDTHYNGYKFRSRLEARWAVFLDKLTIPYLYEPEGFELNTTRYLPDFQLTQGIKRFGDDSPLTNIWIEVKPTLELNDTERQKIAQFIRQTTNKLILTAGDPHPETTIRLITSGPNNKLLSEEVKWIQFNDGQLGLLPLTKLDTITDPDTRNAINQLSEAPTLIAAYRAARQARFENNETPLPPPVTKKQCQSCGKTFIPIQPHYYLCNDCYRQNRPTPPASSPVRATPPPSRPTPTQRPTTTPRPQPKSSLRWPIALIIIAILITTIIAAAALLNQQPQTQLPTIIPTTAALPTDPPTPQPTLTTEPTTAPSPTPICNCTTNTYDCSDFTTQSQAQACYDTCFPTAGDIHFLDSNSDGRACESLP